jgi:hypothetical protein
MRGVGMSRMPIARRVQHVFAHSAASARGEEQRVPLCGQHEACRQGRTVAFPANTTGAMRMDVVQGIQRHATAATRSTAHGPPVPPPPLVPLKQKHPSVTATGKCRAAAVDLSRRKPKRRQGRDCSPNEGRRTAKGRKEQGGRRGATKTPGAQTNRMYMRQRTGTSSPRGK